MAKNNSFNNINNTNVGGGDDDNDHLEDQSSKLTQAPN